MQIIKQFYNANKEKKSQAVAHPYLDQAQNVSLLCEPARDSMCERTCVCERVCVCVYVCVFGLV